MIENSLKNLPIEELEEFVKSFLIKHFELDFEEVTTYIEILRTPTTLSSLAMRLNLDRTKTYRTGNKLTDLGLIESKSGNPKIFYAKDPHESLQYYLETKLDQVKTIESKMDIVKKYLDDIYKKVDFPTPMFTIMQGTNSINSHMVNLIRKSKGNVKLMLNFNDLKKEYFTQLPEVINSSKFDIKIVTNASSNVEEKFLKNFSNCEIKSVDEYYLPRILILENKVMMGIHDENWRYSNKLTKFKDDFATCFLTNSSGIIKTLNTSFDYFWNKEQK